MRRLGVANHDSLTAIMFSVIAENSENISFEGLVNGLVGYYLLQRYAGNQQADAVSVDWPTLSAFTLKYIG